MDHLNWLNTVARSKKRELSDDYYYLSPKELARIHPDSIEILKTYPVTNNALVRPKFKWSHPQICVQQELKFENEPGQRYFIDNTIEYGKTITYIVPDSIAAYKRSLIVFETLVMPTEAQKNGVKMIISLENEKGAYVWAAVSLADYLETPQEWIKVTLTMPLPGNVRTGDKLLIYFWNPEKQEVYVKEMRFKWLRYDQ